MDPHYRTVADIPDSYALPKPKKNTAEYQRDKRLRQAAKRETTKNSWFQRVALSWPAPRQSDGQSA